VLAPQSLRICIMAEIKAAEIPFNPNEGDPDAKISSTSSEHFDEKQDDVHHGEQPNFDESHDPDV
jgi:hypothetical protein